MVTQKDQLNAVAANAAPRAGRAHAAASLACASSIRSRCNFSISSKAGSQARNLLRMRLVAVRTVARKRHQQVDDFVFAER